MYNYYNALYHLALYICHIVFLLLLKDNFIDVDIIINFLLICLL